MGFRGEGSKAIARAFEQCGHVMACAGDLGPDCLLLDWIEEKARVLSGERALLPGSADEAVPILDAGRGPRGEALGAASAMEGVGDGTGGTVAGGDQQSTVTQPCVDSVFR